MPITTVKTTKSRLALPIHAGSKQIIQADMTEVSIPMGWEEILPFAAKELLISADPKDYLIHPVPIMYSDIPNRNGFAFPLSELVKWNVARGCPAYQGWNGMPMYTEHQSDDHKTALGMVIDTSLRRISNMGKGLFWKVMALAAVDRNKNPDIAEKMERGELNTYSMGAMVDYVRCSYCQKLAGQCSHVPESNEQVTFYELNGQLVYKTVHGVNPYELSCVEDPAYGTAAHTHRLDYETGKLIKYE